MNEENNLLPQPLVIPTLITDSKPVIPNIGRARRVLGLSARQLEEFGVPHERRVISAHRQGEKLRGYVFDVEGNLGLFRTSSEITQIEGHPRDEALQIDHHRDLEIKLSDFGNGVGDQVVMFQR